MFVHFLDESAVETKAATAVVGNPSSSVVCATEDACQTILESCEIAKAGIEADKIGTIC